MQTVMNPKSQKTGSLLCIVICGPTLNEARSQIHKATSKADIFEFRIDQFQFSQIEAIALLQEAATLPVIFTIRRRSQGGEFSSDEQQRLEMIRKVAKLCPAYIDIEYDVDTHFFEEIIRISPETKIISSFHDFEYPHKDIQSLFQVMKEKPAHIYKIATMAYSSVDSLRMLRFVKDNSKKGHRVIGICMGENGKATRILAPIYGSAIMYSTLSDDLKTAPGQLTADELINRYHFKKLSQTTHVYGLVGDPVVNSPSHITHNQAFTALGMDAVYMKFNLKGCDIHEFIELAKKLDFRGLSVTMPLKMSVTKELNEISDDAKNIGAVNTIRFANKSVSGTNTDGKGALDAIEEKMKVKGKRIVILGAGGAAKAVAWEAKIRGAHVIILNRTRGKAEEIAHYLSCKAGALEDFPKIAEEGYDILVNCTSVGMYSEKSRLPIDSSHMLVDRVVMDSIPGESDTPFLKEALNKQCSIVYGNDMFMHQAIGQFQFWFGDTISLEELKKIFNETFKKLRR